MRRVTASFEDFDRRARDGEALSVVFFGGSLTWGANASDPQRTSYRALMGQYLKGKYPRAAFTFHDAAIGGTNSKLGMFRLERDVFSRKPDLVFLDFTMNDGAEDCDLPALAAYECLLRELIGRGIPVVQAFFCFRYHFRPDFDAKTLPRYLAHQKLAGAYHTGIGDGLALVQRQLAEGRADIETLWPFDVAHPDDIGYWLFCKAVCEGFEEAVNTKRVCVAPTKPVFPDLYRTRQRIRLVESPLPAGWQRSKTYRSALWFDGLSSRWMDDVAMCDLKDKATIRPLKIEFTGTFVGVFGEADQDGLPFKALVDGKPLSQEVWPFDTRQFGVGQLFLWRELSDKLPPGRHTLELSPVFPDNAKKGQLRIESVCIAGEVKKR